MPEYTDVSVAEQQVPTTRTGLNFALGNVTKLTENARSAVMTENWDRAADYLGKADQWMTAALRGIKRNRAKPPLHDKL